MPILNYNKITIKINKLKEKEKQNLVANVGIKLHIAELNKKIEDASIMSAVEIQQMLTKAARGELEEDCIAVEGCGEGESRAINIKKEITPKDRLKAADQLAKLKGL